MGLVANGAGIREPSGREDVVLLRAGSCSLSWLRCAAECFLPGSLSSVGLPPLLSTEDPEGRAWLVLMLFISLWRSMELPALVFVLGGECREGEAGPWSSLTSQACRCLTMAQNGWHQAWIWELNFLDLICLLEGEGLICTGFPNITLQCLELTQGPDLLSQALAEILLTQLKPKHGTDQSPFVPYLLLWGFPDSLLADSDPF